MWYEQLITFFMTTIEHLLLTTNKS